MIERIVKVKKTGPFGQEGDIILINSQNQKVGGPYTSTIIARQVRARRAKKWGMESLGLTQVKGSLGGTYWE